MSEWARRGQHCWQNAHGYRIATLRVNGVKKFSAFAPPIPEQEYEKRLKVHYRRGERVPVRCEHLGIFTAHENAIAACDEHHRRSAAA